MVLAMRSTSRTGTPMCGTTAIRARTWLPRPTPSSPATPISSGWPMLRRSRSEAPSACPLRRGVTRAEDTPDQFRLHFAGDVVSLDELTPFAMEAGRVEDVDVLEHDGKRAPGIHRAV